MGCKVKATVVAIAALGVDASCRLGTYPGLNFPTLQSLETLLNPDLQIIKHNDTT